MSDNSNQTTSEYKASLKSLDTEETFDLIFYRPLGYAWACMARRLGITPNAITIASIFIGIGAGVCFYFTNLWINLLGVLLLVWANSFDSADGQLARMTGNYSRLGRILDGISGDLWFIAIYAAICLREDMTSPFFMRHPLLIWIIAAVTGAFHGIQAAQADHYRQFHLRFIKGTEGSELDNADELQRQYDAMPWRGNVFGKLIALFYLNYTKGQERRTPAMQRLRIAIRERYGNHIPESFVEYFRSLSKPLMKYTNILTFNWRSFALFAAILIFRMPWLYFAFELTVMNVLLVYMIWRHERICRQALNYLKQH